MKKLLYILLLLPLLAMQCEKENKTPNGGTDNTCDTTQMDSLQCELSKLPPITTTGKGTFAYLLNGKAWLSKAGNSTFIAHRPANDADYFEGQLSIDGARYNGNNTIDGINLITLDYAAQDSSMVILNKDTNGLSYYGTNSCYYGFFNSEFNGEINILRFDSINRVVAGTFKFTTYLVKEDRDGNFEGCGDTLRFTNGRFDIAY